MALETNEALLRRSYVDFLQKSNGKRPSALQLVEIPDSLGIQIIQAAKPISLATYPPKARVIRRRLAVGSILIPAWHPISRTESLDFFDQLAQKTGLPNHWLPMGDYKLLSCYLHIDDLLALIRFYRHILDDPDQGYQKEKQQLEIALALMQEIQTRLPNRLNQADREFLITSLAQIELLVRSSVNQQKQTVNKLFRQLRDASAILYRRFQIMPQVERAIESICSRREKIEFISPILARRYQAAKKLQRSYQAIIASSQTFIRHCLQQTFLSHLPPSLTSALRARANYLKTNIVARPARLFARQAASRLIRTAKLWENQPSQQPISLSLIRHELKLANLFLRAGEKKLAE